MASESAQKKIESYLGKLRARLRGMNEDEIREIAEELRSHIADKAAAAADPTPEQVDAALNALGTPEELASQYLAEALLARAEVSRSPLRILDSLFRWATLSFAGFGVLLAALVGYFIGFAFILCGLLKPFHPQTAGLWVYSDAVYGRVVSIRMGFGAVPAGGRELLGWWMVPIGLVVGCGLVVLTSRFSLWCARQYRSSHKVLPNGKPRQGGCQ